MDDIGVSFTALSKGGQTVANSITKEYLIQEFGSEIIYLRGLNYKEQGRVLIQDDSVTDGCRTINAIVKGSENNSYETGVRLYENDGEVLSFSCTCPFYNQYCEPCKHVIATILSCQQQRVDVSAHIRTTDTRNGSDSSIVSLINSYTKKTINQAAKMKNMPATIEPVLEVGYGKSSVSFKIGNERMYVIKDLFKFKRDMTNAATVEYGKMFVFPHDMSGLDEQSKLYARFIMTHCVENNTRQNSYYYYNLNSDYKKSIILDSYLYDDFFSSCMSNTIKVKDLTGTYTARIEHDDPVLTISILKQSNGNFKISIAEKEIEIFSGGEQLYIIKDRILYICSQEFSENASDFLKTISANSRGFNVANQDMQILMQSVINQIKPYVEIESNDDLNTLHSLPLISKLYVDIPADNIVTASLKFYYGNNRHDAFKEKNLVESYDFKGEVNAEAVILKYFNNIDLNKNYAYIHDDEEALFKLIDEGVDEISESIEIYATEKFKSIQVKPLSTLSVGVRVQSNLLRLSFDLESLDLDEMIDILSSYRQVKKYHRLKSGSFISLENNSIASFAELAEALNISDREILSGEVTVPKSRALYLDSLMKNDLNIKFDRDSSFKKIVRDIKDVSDSDFEVPANLKKTLRSYQKTGYRWLKTIGAYGFGGILADDMGLGKTLQVITLLMSQKLEQKEHTISLVVCPSSLVLNWESEINKFAPELKSLCINGSNAIREDKFKDIKEIDVLITSYDLLKRDIEFYDNLEFQYHIIDEAQYIKNHNTQNARAVKSINSKIHIALTGTPIENSLAELWSIYDFLMPGYLYNYNRFKTKYETPIVKNKDEVVLDGLKRLVSPFILRRLKKDVLKELPDKIETIMYADMEDKQRQIYLANAATAKAEVSKQYESQRAGKDKLLILALLTKLRQICCDPSLLYEDYANGSAKLEMCMELLENCIESGHKILLFSQFTSMLKIIEGKLVARGLSFYKIVGSTKSDERLKLVNAFNADDTSVFLISLKAGGTGLNLTGADVVIHYDPWWNISVQNQATDRAHRIGQKNNVHIYKLIAKDTIEERIIELQKNKAELADMIMNDENTSIASLTKDDILSLF